MNFLEWEKYTKEMCQKITKRLHITELEIEMVIQDELGTHILPKFNKMVISVEQIMKIQKENNQYSLMEITEVLVFHEIGHYIQFIESGGASMGMKAERFQYLDKALGYDGEYSNKEKMNYLDMYVKLLIEHEIEAWDIGYRYYSGNENLYQLLKDQGLKSYEDYSKRLIENEKRRS